MYSPVPNKRPGRLIFSNIFAFGTVIETGTLIFFPTFLESSTIIMVLSALVRLLGFEDCACETGRPRGLRAVRPKRQKRKTYPDETAVQVKFMKKKHNCYIWPTIDDLSIVEDFEIIKTLDPPDLVSRGSYAFNS